MRTSRKLTLRPFPTRLSEMSWLRENLHVLRSVGLLILLASVTHTAMDQYLNARLQELLFNTDGAGAQLWILAAASLLNGLIFPVLMTALSLFGILKAHGSGESLATYAGRVMEQLYIETLRVWGSVLRWGLLLILPAFIRLFQLVFVPFVVILHRSYEDGKVDALRTSWLYVRKRWGKTALALLMFSLILPLVLTDVLDPWRSYENTPLAALFCSVIDVMVAVVSAQVFYRIFESARRELNDESVLSVAGH